jgi:hypothetical protein
MATTPAGKAADQSARFDAPGVLEEVLEEVVDSLQPDRAHHDELGRTVEPDDGCEPSPREQPAEPIDIAHVDE